MVEYPILEKGSKTMKARKCNKEDLIKALELTNKDYDNNIKFKRLDFPTFTLTVKSTADNTRGYRRGHTGRKVAAACWHVHGDFFDNLFSINPSAYIIVSSGTGTKRIDINGGNWEDRNIGSLYSPLMYSEACDCNN